MSMSLHQTSFCFVCSHLASGEKEGDELKRNADVCEILKCTQFPKICKNPNSRAPERINDHEYVNWNNWSPFIFLLFSNSYIVLYMFNVRFLLLLLSNFSRVIWLGDLNYRVALTYEETRVLLEDNDWDTLLEKDQVCTLIYMPTTSLSV